MLRFAANLSWLFTDYDFLDRFERAAKAGFSGVEFLFPYDHDAPLLSQKLVSNSLTLALFNMPPGDWQAGDRGLAILPDRKEEFEESVTKALAYAEALSCKQVHCMAGVMPENADLVEIEQTYLSNLRYAAEMAEKSDIRLLIEPINPIDMPGYYLTRMDQAFDVIEKVGADNLFIQYDIYHAQKMQGDIANTFARYRDRIAHIQIADNPNRHEPGTGEINFEFLFSYLEKAGYVGWIGCEYKPADTTENSLRWLKEACDQS